jgi:hypothetical protein
LGLGLKPSVCHSEPVRIRYARLNCYLTVEEYRRRGVPTGGEVGAAFRLQ